MPEPLRVTKTLSANLLYELQWAKSGNSFLSSGEYITSAQIVERSGAAVISSVTNTGSQTLFYVGSGSLRAVHTIETTISTSRDQVETFSFELQINPYKYAL